MISSKSTLSSEIVNFGERVMFTLVPTFCPTDANTSLRIVCLREFGTFYPGFEVEEPFAVFDGQCRHLQPHSGNRRMTYSQMAISSIRTVSSRRSCHRAFVAYDLRFGDANPDGRSIGMRGRTCRREKSEVALDAPPLRGECQGFDFTFPHGPHNG